MSLFNLLSFDDHEIELIISAVREHCVASHMEMDSSYGRAATDTAIRLFRAGHTTRETLIYQLSRAGGSPPS